MPTHESVTIFDTTLRDGEQSPGCSMTAAEKVRMAHQLDRLGVDVIEAGFPIASDGDFQAVQAVAHEVRRPVIAALARTRRDLTGPRKDEAAAIFVGMMTDSHITEFLTLVAYDHID